MPHVKRTVPPILAPILAPIRALGLALGVLLASGCVRHVTITSDPAGAVVTRGKKELGPTPLQVTVWPVPFLSQSVRVGVSGYRGEKIPLGRNLGLWRTRTKHEVILIQSHGPSGTWLPEEAGEQ